MRKILLDSRAWCLDIFPRMQEILSRSKDGNVEVLSVYHNSLDQKRFSVSSRDENLSLYYEAGRKKYGKENLILFEKKYDLVNLWNVVYFDRFLKNRREEDIVQQLSYYIFAWESILQKHKPQFVVSETVVGAWNYILFGLCKYYKCTYLGYLFTKNTDKYFFSRDIYGVFPEMKMKLDALLKGQLDQEQRAAAVDYSESFQKNFMAPGYLKFFSGLPKIHNFFNPYRILVNVGKDIKTRLHVRNDYKIDYRLSGYKRDMLRLYRIGAARAFSIFEQPRQDEKFVLFPLHFQPEASTEVCAAYYNDQYNDIVHIARSLPFDHKLYVKEHYAVMGTKTIEFYRKIKVLPNVRLIDPWTKVSKLIRDASAVAVLTGTTGLEAIICKKPVIIFGHVFYDLYPQIYRVSNLEELPAIIKKAITGHQVDEEIYLKYIYAYISSGYKGRLLGGNISKEDLQLHCENLLFETGKSAD